MIQQSTQIADCLNCGYSRAHLSSAVCPECGFSNDEKSIATLKKTRRRRKTLFVAGSVLLVLSSCFVYLPFTMFGFNIGLPVGYYGELNRTKWRIRAIEGVAIERVSVNYDLSVEEFTVHVVIDGVHRASIYVPHANLSQRFRAVDQWKENELPTYRNESVIKDIPDESE